MSAWCNSTDWRPPSYSVWNRKDVVPFVGWLAPAAVGALLIAFDKAVTGSVPPWPHQLDQLGLLGGHASVTLLYAPLWGFPAAIVILPILWILLSQGWFGWATALIGGGIAGIAVPLLLGHNLWLAGPLYGAANLWTQRMIHKARYPDTFDA